MHSIYFLTYAILATVIGLIVVWAQYTRYKRDGVPFNTFIIKVIAYVALAMWSGTAFAEYAYLGHEDDPALITMFFGIA